MLQPVLRSRKAGMSFTEFEGRTENCAQPDITAFSAPTVNIDRCENWPDKAFLLRPDVLPTCLRGLLLATGQRLAKMLPVGGKYSQVTGIVVDRYPVDVIHYFGFCQVAPEHLRHHSPVF